MYAWQFQKAQYIAEKNGWTSFVSMQNFYNLIYREEEREMIPLCKEMGVAITPWSPLATGMLCRDWNETTLRSEGNTVFRSKFASTVDKDKLIVERQAEIAKKRGIPRSHVALSWLRYKVQNVVPIIGATKISHIEDAVNSLSVQLTAEEVKYLDELYVPHSILSHD
jgi:aryl-alcohol dehydrogenase-like predicted oxidoreductase